MEADHVFVDGDQSVVGARGALFELHISALLRRDGDSRRFVDVRPFTVVPRLVELRSAVHVPPRRAV